MTVREGTLLPLLCPSGYESLPRHCVNASNIGAIAINLLKAFPSFKPKAQFARIMAARGANVHCMNAKQASTGGQVVNRVAALLRAVSEATPRGARTSELAQK